MLKQYMSHEAAESARASALMMQDQGFRDDAAQFTAAQVVAAVQMVGLENTSLREQLGLSMKCSVGVLRELQEALLEEVSEEDRHWIELLALTPDTRLDVWWFDDLDPPFYSHRAPGHPNTEAEMRQFVEAQRDTTEPPDTEPVMEAP